MNLIDLAFVAKLAVQFPRTSLVLVAGGFPCQEYSSLNTARSGVSSDRGALVYHLPRVQKLCQEVFTGTVVHMMAECTTMDETQLEAVNKILGVAPVLLDTIDMLYVRRPRLFWITWPIEVMLTASPPRQGAAWLQPGQSCSPRLEQRRSCSVLYLVFGKRSPTPYLRPCTAPHPSFSRAFLCFTRAPPEKRGTWKVAGKSRTTVEEQGIWAANRFMFAPY